MERYDPVNMPYTKAMIADKLGGYVKYEDHESEITSLKEQLKGDCEECCTSYKSILLKETEDLKEQLEKEREVIKTVHKLLRKFVNHERVYEYLTNHIETQNQSKDE